MAGFLPATIRFFNPGGMYPGESSRRFGSDGFDIIGGGHKIARFPDAESGAAAQFDLWDRGYANMTLRDATRKWSGNNSSDAYTAHLANATGLTPDAVITRDMLRDPKFAIPFAKAAAQWEAGRPYPIDDATWERAHARYLGSPATATPSDAPSPRMALGGPKPMPQDPVTGQWVPEEWIARKGRMADQLWGVQPTGGRYDGIAGLLAGLGSGFTNAGIGNDLRGNQAMQQDVFRRAANAPDIPSMSSMLLSSGVPNAQRAGMESKISDLQRGLPENVDKRRILAAQARQAEEKEDPHKPYRVRAEVAKAYGLQPGTPEFTQFVLGTKTEPTQKFSVGDITKLTEEGGKFSSVAGFADSFKDEYAGYKSEGIGNAATWMGRYIPGTMGAASKEAAGFWQEYDKYKNKARNDMFGSALTATEQAAFERADINPGMDPKIVRKNLEVQRQALKSAAVKKANALIQAGYDPAPIAAAYGIDLKQFGVQTQRTKGATSIPDAATAPAPPAPDVPPAPAAPQVGEVRKGYRFKGGDPSEPASWEKVAQ